MSEIKVKNPQGIDNYGIESVYSYCSKLSKRNNSILYLLESYLNKKLLDDVELAEIRDIILTVSADISKLHTLLFVESGDKDEGLQ